MSLSAVILTNHEKKDIAETLDSVAFADEVLVIKDSKNDRPLQNNFADQRNYGLAKAISDWVLFVDDDEVVSPELAKEILASINRKTHEGYYLRRLDRFYNQTLHYGETGDIKLVRLAKKSAGYWQRPVHERWVVRGSLGQLNNPLIHHKKDLVGGFIQRICLYGPIDAKALKSEGKPFSFSRLFINPLGKFIRNYVLKLGFRDGLPGLFQAYLMSVQSLSVRIFQWEE